MTMVSSLVVSTGDDWFDDSTGNAYVFFGTATVPPWQPSWNYEVGTEESGGFVTSAGDPNGDGYDELIIKFNRRVPYLMVVTREFRFNRTGLWVMNMETFQLHRLVMLTVMDLAM